MKPSNEITIVRKHVVTNVPGFLDDESGNPQNTWIKVADYYCVETAPAETAKVYELEHDENYSNQDNTYNIEFNFESARQKEMPPYDIQTGDYVCFWQGDQKFAYRIIKATITQIFHNCCVVQLVCNATQPKEVNYLLACGRMRHLEEEDINDGNLPVGEDL